MQSIKQLGEPSVGRASADRHSWRTRMNKCTGAEKYECVWNAICNSRVEMWAFKGCILGDRTEKIDWQSVMKGLKYQNQQVRLHFSHNMKRHLSSSCIKTTAKDAIESRKRHKRYFNSCNTEYFQIKYYPNYAKWNKSEKDHMISLICGIQRTKQINKQNRNRLIDTKNRLMIVRGEDVWEARWKRWRD